ncbi:trehalose synthase /maltokinase [Tistlia consotensis]|uniref:Maltokinase n=1 Tax=Tistlia consotensis USBA 355 TaxID=560819 RepID=A0A1Y6CEV6_9PROT|nr:maltose alpha-D-glucosyltransferase [Tistlia consotensis]SMF57446.1 trehalose synthase /maltokinase [Tistlia consotensis USBA 355]SNR45770.1 trehalose synthase /maltokinase [Tistlia consotensis]
MDHPLPAETSPATPPRRRKTPDGTIDRGQTDWYKDAIIYQLHVKAFQDSNGDGLGDFAGLMQRLDYVQELGVTAIWLLPFYPSPLRDDGYDIADYRSINPSYGTMKDFKGFIAEAHRRGLRVITELVINHTSDQHPWFQKARKAKAGSAARNFYVWSDTDQKYQGTRIIFLDTEKSNWTWDPEAEAFFWHRFYSHQPDLNFDNPRVMKEVLKVMHMWLDMGVDGLRLDAIPYLVEREGTNNENLPETHEVLKQVRASLDEKYSDRMLLAEANQWPEDTRPYFGEGDECHMGFHFPLMPRMYMALAQEDRHPVTDIIRQTPEIPEPCQWAIFLRNHDELTLEMVTEEERDYLWRTYAADTRARINLGIRRRLAPLMQNDRRKIELMNALLLSMPGTPILYYGDELGMGDNYFLGDRDGVRTPMQWSTDRNAGFSRANPQQLYLPPIMDPVYGYQAINVEAQRADPSSLLNWTRRMVSVRKQHGAFGRGTIGFLYPHNRKILAYVRECRGESGDEAILCVANLARSAQAVELDLSRFRGAVPVELTGGSPFPPVGDLPYLLTLPAYGFYWFLLADEAEMPHWHQPMPEPLPEFITVTSRDGRVSSVLTGREKRQLESETLPSFLPLQRWFAAKDERIASVSLTPLGSLDNPDHLLATAEVVLKGAESDAPQRYFLPLAARWGEENLRAGAPKLSYTLAKIRKGPRVGALIDGAHDEAFAEELLRAMQAGRRNEADGHVLRCSGSERLAAIEDFGAPRPLGVEQSNISIVFSDKAIMKLYRRLRAGEQPDVEVARFLTETAGYPNTPALLGSIDVVEGEGEPTTLVAAFAFVPNQGDAWGVVAAALERDLEEQALRQPDAETPAEPEGFDFPLELGPLLGRRTAELHRALAAPTDDPAFACEPLTRADLKRWSREAQAEARAMLSKLQGARDRLPEAAQAEVRRLLELKGRLTHRLKAVAELAPSGARSRIHGDYHLGQILVAQNDLVVIDFEGEPGRSLSERRLKSSPLRDLAGLLRSLDYAAATAASRYSQRLGIDQEAVARRARLWRDRTTSAVLASYRETIAGAPTWPEDPALGEGLLELFLLQKAVYEIGYELANRPAWLSVPLAGLIDLLERHDHLESHGTP